MTKSRRQSGFSLMELMVVLAILTIVVGIVFTTVASVQQRTQSESQKVDVTQNSREFMDQIERDLRNLGYPNARMYIPSALSSPAVNSKILAAGMVAASATDIWFEGDVDGSGSISSVRYTLQADASGKCPCTLRRSAVYRGIAAPTSVVHDSATYSAELNGIVNSIGGSSPWAIAGTAPNGTSNDSLYGGFKAAPVFRYFDKNNTEITVPDDLASSGNVSAGATAAPSIAYVVITVNVLSAIPDQQTGLRAATPMQSSIRLSNL
jgi:prepilin-type N-terminal cleavage/methylation domain-containing protein